MNRPHLAALLLLALLPAHVAAQQAAQPAPKLALVPLTAPKPVLPDSACQQRLSGWVEVEFAVLPDGRVAEAKAVKSQPPGVFDAAATASVSGRLYAAQAAPVKMKERVLLTYADCRSEQLKAAADAAAGQLSAQECIALANEGRKSGERFGVIDSGRAILAGTVAQVFAGPSPACPVIGKTLKPGARWRAHLEHNGYSLISPPKADESAAVWVRSGDLKDVEMTDLLVARPAPGAAPATPPPAQPAPSTPVPPAPTLSAPVPTTPPSAADAKALVAAHESMLRGYLSGDLELALGPDGGEFVMAQHGAVTQPTRETRKARLRAYLRSAKFTVYRDQVPPIVKVSADGSLGWVIAQIEARGEQTGADGQPEPLDFVTATVELFEKRNGRWVAVGVASNLRP